MVEPAADGSPEILNEEPVVHHRVGGMNKGSGSPVRKTSPASQPYPDREQSQYEAASEASFGNWDNSPWNAGKGNGKMEPRLHQLLTRLGNAQPNSAGYALSDRGSRGGPRFGSLRLRPQLDNRCQRLYLNPSLIFHLRPDRGVTIFEDFVGVRNITQAFSIAQRLG